mgnify:CR=1 FL=1
MPMEAHDIEALIRSDFPDAQITITDLAGDGNHWAAEVIDAALVLIENPRAELSELLEHVKGQALQVVVRRAN